MSAEVIKEATREGLAKISEDSSEHFVRVADGISWTTAEGLTEFCSLCAAMGGSGWKSYESLNVYLNVAMMLQSESDLLRVGQFCRQMSGYSFEPTNRYLALVVVAVDLKKSHYLPRIERVALNYRERYQHASGLLVDFFAAAAHLLEQIDSARYDAWLRAAMSLISGRRNQIEDFFSQSRSVSNVDWHFLYLLIQNSSDAASCYLGQADNFCSFSPELLRLSHALIEKHLSEQVIELILILPSVRSLDEGDALALLSLALQCTNAFTAVILIEHAKDLPLSCPPVVEEWLAVGCYEAGDNMAMQAAWVGLESLKSVKCLENLLGVVRLEDHHRVFDLIAEAVAGRRMIVSANESADDIRSDVVVCNGKDIYLPELVARFESSQKNFDFYRVSILHQLGYLEFGLFQNISRVRKHLAGFSQLALAEAIFSAVENARVDWLLEHHYPGIGKAIVTQKQRAWSDRNKTLIDDSQQLLEALIGIGLDANIERRITNRLATLTGKLEACFEPLRLPDASLDDSLSVADHCYELIDSYLRSSGASIEKSQGSILTIDELPEPVAFRGEMDMARVEITLKIEALLNEIEESTEDGQENLSGGAGNPDQLDPSDLTEGEVGAGSSVTIEELARQVDANELDIQSLAVGQLSEVLGQLASGKKEADVHRYDEWDYSIKDYRSRWCTLFEHLDIEEDDEYFRRTLVDYQALAQRIRHQLNRVRPEMLKKVRGFSEGEELDLERSVEFLVDKRARLTPDDKIYIQRQRKERDVATLFLLDMSASTDDIIGDPENEPQIDSEIEDEDRMMEYFQMRKAYEESARRIIDLEKQSVILMSESLENLGDAYSVCGFSGYGRDQVDYYRFKGFDDPLDQIAKSRIGGMKPCRSTRMGAPIRHATRQLLETGSRIKALIVISDGYPQDHDYGADRNSREYGLMDTMKALTEARQQGVLPYCLTVDPSGHDYLREMCPEGQYMVIQDIEHLPEELSRVYRSLTG